MTGSPEGLPVDRRQPRLLGAESFAAQSPGTMLEAQGMSSLTSLVYLVLQVPKGLSFASTHSAVLEWMCLCFLPVGLNPIPCSRTTWETLPLQSVPGPSGPWRAPPPMNSSSSVCTLIWLFEWPLLPSRSVDLTL